RWPAIFHGTRQRNVTKLCIRNLSARPIKLLHRLQPDHRSGFSFAKRGYMWNCARLFLPRETMAYAIIRTGGRQFRVAEGDTLDVHLLDVERGKTATFGDVLLFADGKDVSHGNPLVSGAKVTAEVV